MGSGCDGMARKNTLSCKHRLCHAALRRVKAVFQRGMPPIWLTCGAPARSAKWASFTTPVGNIAQYGVRQQKRLNTKRLSFGPCRMAVYRRQRACSRGLSEREHPPSTRLPPSPGFGGTSWRDKSSLTYKIADIRVMDCHRCRQLSRTGWQRAPQEPGCRSKWPAISPPHFRHRLPSRA
jgi:hypothetical protein